MKLRVLSLFAGIGGFDLGLERTGGFETVAFCEIDPFCRRVLAKHWPGVPVYGDVRELTAERLRADGIVPDVICAGFPCQDISYAGAGAGLAGSRSGLFWEMVRAVRVVRPRLVLLENVAALLGRGLDTVVRALAEIGYDAEWHCIPAAAIGAPHRRDRIWIIAYPRGEQHEGGGAPFSGAIAEELARLGEMADADSSGLAKRELFAGSEGGQRRAPEGQEPAVGAWWATEPNVGRVAHGVPGRVDRLRCLGNAVVPQIPELIGRAILESLAA